MRRTPLDIKLVKPVNKRLRFKATKQGTGESSQKPNKFITTVKFTFVHPLGHPYFKHNFLFFIVFTIRRLNLAFPNQLGCHSIFLINFSNLVVIMYLNIGDVFIPQCCIWIAMTWKYRRLEYDAQLHHGKFSKHNFCVAVDVILHCCVVPSSRQNCLLYHLCLWVSRANKLYSQRWWKPLWLLSGV